MSAIFMYLLILCASFLIAWICLQIYKIFESYFQVKKSREEELEEDESEEENT